MRNLSHFQKTDIRFWRNAVFRQPYTVGRQRGELGPGMPPRSRPPWPGSITTMAGCASNAAESASHNRKHEQPLTTDRFVLRDFFKPQTQRNRLTRDGKVANPTPFAWAYDSMHSFVNRERCVWPVVRMLAKALRSRRRWPTYTLLRSRHKQPRSVARTTPRCANPASDCLDNPTICKEPLTLLPIANSKEARKRG
jgi:hypothetical protein